MGSDDGSIMATHVVANMAAAPARLCSGIRIHIIDIVQPPAIGMPPMAAP
jgi:hypothetical protein